MDANRKSKRVLLVIVWFSVFWYLILGGQIFKTIEKDHELRTAQEYCEDLGLLLRRLNVKQRKYFTDMMDAQVDANLCRASICKIEALPPIAGEISLEVNSSTTCASLMKNRKIVQNSAQLALKQKGVGASFVHISGCTPHTSRCARLHHGDD